MILKDTRELEAYVDAAIKNHDKRVETSHDDREAELLAWCRGELMAVKARLEYLPKYEVTNIIDMEKCTAECVDSGNKVKYGRECGFVLDDPEKLQEGDGSMIAELTKSLMEQIPPANVIQHANICYELNSLYERKNRDYGDSFHKTYLEEGMAMARIRLTDKLERFKKLTREGGQEVKDESIRDTLIDMANYAIMTAMEMDREAEENGCS